MRSAENGSGILSSGTVRRCSRYRNSVCRGWVFGREGIKMDGPPIRCRRNRRRVPASSSKPTVFVKLRVKRVRAPIDPARSFAKFWNEGRSSTLGVCVIFFFSVEGHRNQDKLLNIQPAAKLFVERSLLTGDSYACCCISGTASGLRFYCPNDGCGRNYKNKCSLKYHMNNECGLNPKFTCRFCPKVSSRYSNLKRHMISVHKYLEDVPPKQIDSNRDASVSAGR